MIELNNVEACYGKEIVLKGINLSISGGTLVVLIGPSGCGKTTTLKTINRMIELVSGSITIGNEDILTIKPKLLRRKIGYVIQSVGLFPHMTVFENIATVPRLLKWEKRRIENRVEELLDLVGLDATNYCFKYPYELSGGEAQRVGVARALAADPPILLMDEPFGAVDPLTREKLQTEFIKIQSIVKKTIVFVTHDLDEAIRLADKIVIMKNGSIVQYGSPEEILSHPVNHFVRDFVGTDRALKRLIRFPVSDIMRKALQTLITNPPNSINKTGDRYVWITDKLGCLVGWLDIFDIKNHDTIESAMTMIDYKSFALQSNSTLKEALSKIISQGVKTVPVVDKQGVLIGEISLDDIEGKTKNT